MRDLSSLSSFVKEKLTEKNIDKAYWTLSESEKTEFNTEGADFSLLRTVFGVSATVKVYNNHRPGLANGNDISQNGLNNLLDTAITSSLSAPEDTCYDLVERQENETFNEGVIEPDLDKFFFRIQEMLKTIKEEHPSILMMAVFAYHNKAHTVYENTNGTCYESNKGYYSVEAEFAATNGEQTTGICFFGFNTDDLSTPFMELDGTLQAIKTAEMSLNLVQLPEKFTGKVLFTPECFGSFVVGNIFNNYLSDGVLLNGTSLWKDKIGEKIADSKLTILSNPYDKNIVCAPKIILDGCKAEPTYFIENGVLKNHLISLYVANKLGRTPTKSLASGIVVNTGDKTFEEMIASMDKGIIMGAFSGGEPSASGDFSGVAKNAFYVENGKIVGAVNETMINGNFGDLLNNIVSLSKTQYHDGASLIPYVLVDGIVISGK